MTSTGARENVARQRIADWIARGAMKVGTAPLKAPHGWCVLDADGSAVLLDEPQAIIQNDLQPDIGELARFPAPDGVGLTTPGRHAVVSPDRRWAAFAGDGALAVVDAEGRTVWRQRVERPGAVRFTDDGHLAAYIPNAAGFERRIVALPGGRVAESSAVRRETPGEQVHADADGLVIVQRESEHVLLDPHTGEPVATVFYADPRRDPGTADVAHGGDGTWMTWSDEQPLQLWRLLPERHADLIAEAPIETTGTPLRLPYGWCASAPDGSAVLLGEDLRLVARIPRPESFTEADPRLSVSRDGQWAAFAGARHTVAVDAGGRIVWEARHPGMFDHSDKPAPGEVVFPPEDGHLWVFVPVFDPEYDDEEEHDEYGVETCELRIVDLATGQVLLVAPKRTSFMARLRIHPDGRTFAERSWDPHQGHGGAWARWTETGTLSYIGGVENAYPADVHPDGMHWLASGYTGPELHRFGSEDSTKYWDEWYEYENTCFASDGYVLVRRTMRSSPWREIEQRTAHVLIAMSDMTVVAAAVRYPDDSTHSDDVVGGNNGTWVTHRHNQPLRLWRLRN